MSTDRSLYLLIATFFLIVLVLSCDLTGTSVDCDVDDLIAKIHNANANPAASTLNLASGCTYTLTAIDNTATSTSGGTVFEYGDNGLPQIVTPITINGNNAVITRSEDAPYFRFFYVDDAGRLIINDLTLQNGVADISGDAFQSSGGAIYNTGSEVEVRNSILQNNQAGFHGGALFAINNATTYVNDSSINENSAPHGGGIFIYHGGLLSIDNSDIENNIADTSGGGISLDYGAELIITDSQVDSNHAGRHGGGIFKDGGADRLPTTITNTTFIENSADWGGGGVFIWRTSLTIHDSTFINNTSDEYGGGLCYQNDSTEIVQISGTTFTGNSSGLDGGAIQFSGELMTVSGSTILGNQAENGGGIHNGPVDDSKYIIKTDSELIITSSNVNENEASENGGGIFNSSLMTCGEASFEVNQSVFMGGGIYNAGELEVNGCSFNKNSAEEDGGGIFNENVAAIRGSDFLNNESDRGGAIAASMGNSQVRDSIFAGNKAESDGGGIYNNGMMVVDDSSFEENEAVLLGGGIHNTNEIKIEDSSFYKNIAGADGGGCNTYDKATITGSTFAENTGFRGGGLASIGGDTILVNDTFSANQAVDSGGGLFNMGPIIGDVSAGGSMQANHITAAFNGAPYGGGVAATGGLFKIKNSIVALSTSGSDCQATNVDLTSVAENIDTDGTCVGFTLKEDPLLKVLSNYGGPTETHALETDSPAIDAAPDCTTIGGSTLTIDQRAYTRPGGVLCDLGAFEDESGLPLPAIQPCTFTATTSVNCRLGPDNRFYPIIDSFKQGQSALVVGQSWDRVFVYVEGPINGEICAVPATQQFGYLEGDCDQVQILEAPDVDESLPDDNEPDEPEKPTGCTVLLKDGSIKCVVPCPPNAIPGDPCTP